MIELPEFGFWLYSIDRFHEDDRLRNSHANTRGPTGFLRLKNADPKYFDLTLQNVARSSYWVHQNNLLKEKNQRIEFDPKGIDITLRRPDENLGKVPICYNPGGESISGVMDEKGQNYPCMCGNFGWNNGWWSIEKDETLKFLAQSGLMFSEDFEDWCSNKNKCKGANHIDWHSQLEAMRKPNDPPIPKHLKHPFSKCKKRRDSQKHPGWPGKDMTPEHKERSETKWARYDEQGRNTSTGVLGFVP
ncbi:hypothetical protein N0V94_000570 [Neodidymelliopsis sp. IMI 364377]|nr:hypothetical protein N0V94_000570 [Neodidymelliopsis sp. IMI 364377]